MTSRFSGVRASKIDEKLETENLVKTSLGLLADFCFFAS